MIVREAEWGAVGFDTIAKLSFDQLAILRRSVRFRVAYLGNIDRPEVDNTLRAGLALMFVTFSRKVGWSPTAELGDQDGAQDVAHLTALDLPVRGHTVWNDLEGCSGTVDTTSAWANNRALRHLNFGVKPGLYVGAGQALNGHQLYALKDVSYWQSCSRGVPEPDCGFQMQQMYKPNQTIAGVEIDLNILRHDFLGRLPFWIEAA